MMTLPHHNMRDDNALHSDDCVKKENANKWRNATHNRFTQPHTYILNFS
jgi:hypothetical protein